MLANSPLDLSDVYNLLALGPDLFQFMLALFNNALLVTAKRLDAFGYTGGDALVVLTAKGRAFSTEKVQIFWVNLLATRNSARCNLGWY